MQKRERERERERGRQVGRSLDRMSFGYDALSADEVDDNGYAWDSFIATSDDSQ